MRTARLLVWTAALLGAWQGASARAEVVIENATIRLVFGDDGRWRSLVDRRTGTDWCYADAGVRLLDARIAGKRDQVAAISYDGTLLEARFGESATTLTYEVTPSPDWIRFALKSVRGPRPERLTLLRVPVAIGDTVSRHLNLARNDEVAVCLLAANLRTGGSASFRGKWADLRAFTQDAPGPKLEGAAAALFLQPVSRIRGALQRAAEAFGLPTNTRDGVPAKELPEAKGSYWFLSFGEKDVDKVVEYCRRSGIRQVMLSFGAWSTGAGHYAINTRHYPEGIASLKASVDRLHAAGIRVGMHTFASKVKKTDPYVSPIPDRRFWTDMSTVLAESITAEQTEIRVAGSLDQWPGSPICRKKSWEGGIAKHREVIIDDEIVRYETIGPEGRYDTFLGCTRGAWKTQARAHRAGTPGRHYGVDGCIDGYIIDQETDLLDEVTTNLARVFNTCGFDMVYFDGGEDVDRRRFNYYVTRHQAMAMAKFTKRPIIHMGTIMTHRLWHSFSRAGTVDHYMNTVRGRMIALGGADNVERVKEVVNGVVKRTIAYELQGKKERWRTVKEHIDLSVERALEMERGFMPGELGWFGIWGRDSHTDGLQLDEAEYLMVKSLAYDQPVSLQTSFRRMELHPLTPQILRIVKAYETMRMSNTPIEPSTRERLRQPGKDYILLQDGAAPRFVEVSEVPEVAGSNDRVRAFVGARERGSVATLWHTDRNGTLFLAVRPDRLRAASFGGDPLPVTSVNGKAAIHVDNRRTTLYFAELSPTEVRQRFEQATFEETPPARIWLQAEDFTRSVGSMAKGSAVGIRDRDAFGDVIVFTGKPVRMRTEQWYCEYTVDLPRQAAWTIWGRMRFPSRSDDSFWFVPQSRNPRSSRKSVFGNCGASAGAWHWSGTGAGRADPPPGRPITRILPRGPFTFRVYPREGGGTVRRNPRLDMICLTDDPQYRPTDEDAAADLKTRAD